MIDKEDPHIVPEQAIQLASLFENASSGIAILEAADNWRLLYANNCMCNWLAENEGKKELYNHPLAAILPSTLYHQIVPTLQKVLFTGKRFQRNEIPYEGFLETRGRTYWSIIIERMPLEDLSDQSSTKETCVLLVTVEDVTAIVRSRMYINAIHAISAAIVGPSSLHRVLERILQVLHEMVGSKRCAIYLIDIPASLSETMFDYHGNVQEHPTPHSLTARLAAQRGLHTTSQNWRPRTDQHSLLSRVLTEKSTLIVTDTQTVSDITLPYLNHNGMACQPGSALCVPIFEPSTDIPKDLTEPLETIDHRNTAVLGTIEVYHRRARGFPAEEVELLERFALQVGLAIQQASLLRRIDHWARTASRHARQKENIMQAMPDSVIIYDAQWRIADLNQAARELFGWTEQVIGQTVVQAFTTSSTTFSPSFFSQFDPVMELEKRALQHHIAEFRVSNTKKNDLRMRCSYTPILDDQGDISAFITMFHDITEEVAARERVEAEVIARTSELKQRNLALQQTKAAQELTNAQMSLLLESLPSSVLLISAYKSSIVIINRQAAKLLQSLGVSFAQDDDLEKARQNAIGFNCEEIMRAIPIYTTNGTLLPYEENPLYKALVLGLTSDAELQMTCRNGQTMYLLANAAPLRTTDGTIASAILVFQEITRIKLLERAREDFFTTMAHELKTPLANIRAHLSALLANDLQWSNEEQRTFLQTADEQVDRLVGMINQFLDASRVEAGALRLETEAIFIPELFEDLQDRLSALISSSGKQLHIDYPVSLPAVAGDYELIIRVLINLLSNAFRYAPAGDKITLRARSVHQDPESPQTVELSVTDNGPGLSMEQQTTLFTRFSTFSAITRPNNRQPGSLAVDITSPKGRSPASWSSATGLGLYISRGIIEAHGSKLTLTSSPGQGATFSFTLPVFQ